MRQRITHSSEGYQRIPHDEGFSDAQFEEPPQKIPWKAISLAAFLFVIGSVLLLTGTLIVSGHIDSKFSDRLWPLIVLGGLMFIPGAYHMRIVFCAFKQYPGYSYSDVPQLN